MGMRVLWDLWKTSFGYFCLVKNKFWLFLPGSCFLTFNVMVWNGLATCLHDRGYWTRPLRSGKLSHGCTLHLAGWIKWIKVWFIRIKEVRERKLKWKENKHLLCASSRKRWLQPDFRTIPEAANTIGQTQTRVQHPLEVRTPVAICFIRAGPTRPFKVKNRSTQKRSVSMFCKPRNSKFAGQMPSLTMQESYHTETSQIDIPFQIFRGS